MFKKLLAGLLAASLVLSLASCNNGGGDTSSTESTGGDSSAAESTGGNEGGDGEYSGTLTIWKVIPPELFAATLTRLTSLRNIRIWKSRWRLRLRIPIKAHCRLLSAPTRSRCILELGHQEWYPGEHSC